MPARDMTVLWMTFFVVIGLWGRANGQEADFVASSVASKSAPSFTGRYLLSYHASAVSNASDPRNHYTYIAQSDDGRTWSAPSGYTAFQGSVPDLLWRSNVLYVYNPNTLHTYRPDTGVWTTNTVTIYQTNSTTEMFVDPSPTLDNSNRIVLFYLVGMTNGDPASLPEGVTNGTKYFRSATEIVGSNGSAFVADPGNRAEVALVQGEFASDPDIFRDAARYILLISRGQSVQALSATNFQGAYSNIAGLTNGILTQAGGVPAGHYDPATSNYWIYVQASGGSSGASAVRCASVSSLTQFIGAAAFTTVVDGASLTSVYGSAVQVGSPGFVTNAGSSGAASNTPASVTPDVKVNGSDGPFVLSASGLLSVTVSLPDGSQSGANADWWIAAQTPMGLYWYTFAGWVFNATQPVYQGALQTVTSAEILRLSATGLPVGTYTFYFGVDTTVNGQLDFDSLRYDAAVVLVQ